MNISKIIIALFLTIGSVTNVISQNTSTTEEVEAVALEMLNQFNDKNYDVLVDMTYPKLFEIVPKEAMVATLKSMLEGNEDLEIKIPNEIPDYKISKIFTAEENNAKYAFLSYNMKMNMTFKKEEFNEEDQAIMIDLMKTRGMDVTFLSNNSMDAIINNTITIIIKDDFTNGKWNMLNFDENSPFLSKLLSTSIIKKTTEYKQNLMLESKKEN